MNILKQIKNTEALKHFFGMRKVKSMIAIFICFLLWTLIRLIFPQLNLEIHPIYAYFYSVFEMRDTIETGIRTGKSRIKATIVGFLVAFIAILVTESFISSISSHWIIIIIEIIIFVVGVLFSINIAEFVKCTTLCGIAASTFIACFSIRDSNPYIFALLRFVQTFMGTGIAFTVNMLIFKPLDDKC